MPRVRVALQVTTQEDSGEVQRLISVENDLFYITNFRNQDLFYKNHLQFGDKFENSQLLKGALLSLPIKFQQLFLMLLKLK